MNWHESCRETITLGSAHASRSRGLLRHRSFGPSAHAALFRFLDRLIRAGRLTVVDTGGGTRTFGPGGTPAVTVRLHERALAWRLLANPGLAVGEAYMDGSLTIEEGTLHEFLHLCTANAQGPEVHLGHRISEWLKKPLRHLHQYNPIRRARANVTHHYDLSGAFYELFLDRDRQYSCAYFPEGGESLEEAQAKKKRHIAAKLLLEPGMTVLDVGSGWGGLALELAQTTHVEVTGITLSEEQLKTARERAVTAKLDDRVRFALRDYREEQGVYDRIVSVGMFEHVGAAHFRTFFDTLRRVLKPDGVALLHAIGRMEPPGGTNPWLRKYIFPGSYCPALSETLAAIERGWALGHRYRDSPSPLRRDAPPLVRAVPGQPRSGQSDLRRALLPDVGVLPRRLRGGVPQRAHDGVPGPACTAPRRGAAGARLRHGLGAPGRRAGGCPGMSGVPRAPDP